MSIAPLAQLSLDKVPYSQIPRMSLKQKAVVHYELYPHAFQSRSIRGRPLYSICDCINFGRCLCYLEIVRFEMVEMFWDDAERYVTLRGWRKRSD